MVQPPALERTPPGAVTPGPVADPAAASKRIAPGRGHSSAAVVVTHTARRAGRARPARAAPRPGGAGPDEVGERERAHVALRHGGDDGDARTGALQ